MANTAKANLYFIIVFIYELQIIENRKESLECSFLNIFHGPSRKIWIRRVSFTKNKKKKKEKNTQKASSCARNEFNCTRCSIERITLSNLLNSSAGERYGAKRSGCILSQALFRFESRGTTGSGFSGSHTLDTRGGRNSNSIHHPCDTAVSF